MKFINLINKYMTRHSIVISPKDIKDLQISIENVQSENYKKDGEEYTRWFVRDMSKGLYACGDTREEAISNYIGIYFM